MSTRLVLTIDIPDYSPDELGIAAVTFLGLDRDPDAVDMLMAVLDGALEISYIPVHQDVSERP